jgi:hypothetical protein
VSGPPACRYALLVQLSAQNPRCGANFRLNNRNLEQDYSAVKQSSQGIFHLSHEQLYYCRNFAQTLSTPFCRLHHLLVRADCRATDARLCTQNDLSVNNTMLGKQVSELVSSLFQQ